jgi:type I restriction enzyme M protein
MSLGRTIKSVQDILRKDAGLDGDPQRISQLVWMLFLKMFDDTEISAKTPIPEKYKWKSWTKAELNDQTLIDFVNKELFPTLRNLPDVKGQVPRAKLVEEIFENSHNYMTSGALMRQVIEKLDNSFNFNSAENRHLFNDIYETILKDIQNSRYSGEFYTPRAVTQFIIERIDPQPGESVSDPACGTGGFLSSATENIKSKCEKNNIEWDEHLQSLIKGGEKKSLPFMLCVTNLLLHNIEVPNVIRDNAFSKPLDQISTADQVNIVVTNPPFGGMEEDSILKKFSSEFSTKETSDLFMLLIMKILKPKGRAGVILPDGFLFGTGAKARIKEQLLTSFNLHTVYRLPRGVFSPYTDINTNVLFFDKGKETSDVWFFEHPSPVARNGKPYNKTNPINISEFEVSKDWWINRTENENAWKVNIREIRERDYNLDFKNPHKQKSVQHSSSILVMKSLIDNQLSINTLLSNIEKDLMS